MLAQAALIAAHCWCRPAMVIRPPRRLPSPASARSRRTQESRLHSAYSGRFARAIGKCWFGWAVVETRPESLSPDRAPAASGSLQTVLLPASRTEKDTACIVHPRRARTRSTHSWGSLPDSLWVTRVHRFPKQIRTEVSQQTWESAVSRGSGVLARQRLPLCPEPNIHCRQCIAI